MLDTSHNAKRRSACASAVYFPGREAQSIETAHCIGSPVFWSPQIPPQAAGPVPEREPSLTIVAGPIADRIPARLLRHRRETRRSPVSTAPQECLHLVLSTHTCLPFKAL